MKILMKSTFFFNEPVQTAYFIALPLPFSHRVQLKALVKHTPFNHKTLIDYRHELLPESGRHHQPPLLIHFAFMHTDQIGHWVFVSGVKI
jgi:hypothetical protein